MSSIFVNMNTQQAVVEQIVQNLAFEVEAVPKNESIQASSISQSTPLNVKIRVRKKDEIYVRHDDSSITDDTTKPLQKIRLVSSDQTIMTFDVFMEAEFEKKPPRNLRKHIIDMLKPGICLGAMDDDDYPYMPSSSYTANITEPSVAAKSDGTLKQTFTLSKNAYQDYTVSTQPGGQKWFFGRCKPGGCLDPPFSEDKYSYKPSTRSGPEQVIPEPNVSSKEELRDENDIECDVDSSRRPSTLHDEEVKSNGRHSSIFDGKLFKKKRRSSDKSTNTKLPENTDSFLDLYQVKSATNSGSTHSNSIITYPPKILSDLKISDDKTVRSRSPSEDKSRKSFNDHSEPYFIPPKGVRIKEKDTLNHRDYPNHRISDVTNLRNSLKESFKMPVPIPIPIPLMSNKREPEVIATNDISKTQGDNANVITLPPNKELEDKINVKDTETSPEYLRTESATGDTDGSPMEPSEMATSVPSNFDQPTAFNKIDDINLDATKLQPYAEMDKNYTKVTEQPNKKAETEPLKIPIPVPVLLGVTDPNCGVDNSTVNDSKKITQSEQSLGTEPTPHIIKGKSFEEFKDQNKVSSEESVSAANTLIPNLQCNDKEAESIQKTYLRTISDSIVQESGNENPLIKKPTMEGDVEPDSKGDEITDEKLVKQNDVKHKDSTNAFNNQEESSDIYKIPDTDAHEIKDSPNKDILNDNEISSASIRDKTKRSDSGNKRLFDVKHKDGTNAFNNQEESSELYKIPDTDAHEIKGSPNKDSLNDNEISSASIRDKTKRSDSDDKRLFDVKRKDGTNAFNNQEESSELYKIPDTDAHEIKGSPNKDNINDSEISAASIRDKTKRSDSADKRLFQMDDTDIVSDNKDENKKLLRSGPSDETDAGNATVSQLYSDKDNFAESTKPSYDDKIDASTERRFTNDRRMNFIIAPTIIDKTEPSPNFRQLKEVYSETNLLSESLFKSSGPFTAEIASKFKKFDEDNLTNSTLSNELIGTKSVIYDMDDHIPSTSSVKNPERTASPDKRIILPEDTGKSSPEIVSKSPRISSGIKGSSGDLRNKLTDKSNIIRSTSVLSSSIPSTSTLKSAMKKDTISIELGFQSYLNDKNERILRTFDTANAPIRFPNDSVTVLKSQIRMSSNEIRIPVDSDHDMSIKIKKSNINQRVSIGESVVNLIDNGRVIKQKSPAVQYNDTEKRSSEAKERDIIVESDVTDDNVIDLYEQELVPLQLIIKNLRDEIDVLAAQQLIFKDKIFCPNKSKLPRLVHSNKKCFGCVKK